MATVRVAAVQTQRRTISYKVGPVDAALQCVHGNLDCAHGTG